jgi:membrane protein YqaA with SNARE-associated domain
MLVVRIAALILVVAISLLIYNFREEAERLAIYGYPGIFLLSLLSYATVFLPAPGIAIVFTMGNLLHPVGLALAAGTGAALGELSGYLAGFSGQVVIERVEMNDRLSRWMRRFGPVTIFILAAIPNPFFDIAGVVAGSLKFKITTFLIFCWFGEVIKMLAFALLGSRLFDFFNI